MRAAAGCSGSWLRKGRWQGGRAVRRRSVGRRSGAWLVPGPRPRIRLCGLPGMKPGCRFGARVRAETGPGRSTPIGRYSGRRSCRPLAACRLDSPVGDPAGVVSMVDRGHGDIADHGTDGIQHRPGESRPVVPRVLSGNQPCLGGFGSVEGLVAALPEHLRWRDRHYYRVDVVGCPRPQPESFRCDQVVSHATIVRAASIGFVVEERNSPDAG